MIKSLLSRLVIFIILIAGCGKDPNPPAPEPKPETLFEVRGASIAVKGEMKPGSKLSLSEMKAAVQVAVQQLESR